VILFGMNIVILTFILKIHSLLTLETYMVLSMQSGSDMIQSITEQTLLATSSSSLLTTTITTAAASEEQKHTIRTWGCNLQQTPLIFIHIGKSGGGMVRARFAAAALGYARLNWKSLGDKAYYPTASSNIDSSNIPVHDEQYKAYFCSSGHPNFKSNGEQTYERTIYCHAATPLGQAVSCPEPVNHRTYQCTRGCDIKSDSCRTVYVGHNLLGNEMHWLPPRYLQKWWQTVYQPQQQQNAAASEDNMISSFLQSLTPNNKTWCPYYEIARPKEYNESTYIQCSATLAPAVDKHAVHAIHTLSSFFVSSSSIQQQQQHIHNIDWSPIYASIPVLRTTLMREPFSWLLSKYFWHGAPNGTTCDDLDIATNNIGLSSASTTSHVFQVNVKKQNGSGWLNRYAWYYILILCGEDCDARYFMGIGNLDQMERQAANNIRNSIAVVGLLNETERFYDMVSARVVSSEVHLL
jgi:hypothetical protein